MNDKFATEPMKDKGCGANMLVYLYNLGKSNFIIYNQNKKLTGHDDYGSIHF